jgi:hypothetical protein
LDFSDEHYVKLFTRKTPTRQLWPWQARALHPNLLMALNKAGVMDVGRHDPVRSVAVMVDLPSEVVGPGLEAMLADGTVELADGKLVMPKFLDAQESRKTKAATAREYREKKRDEARANSTGLLTSTVTKRDQPRPTVTNGDPPALPCPTPALPDPEKLAGDKRPRPKKPKVDSPAPPDPRHADAVKALTRAFRTVTGTEYPFQPRDARAVQQLLAMTPVGDGARLVSIWSQALAHQGFPTVRTLPELVTHFAHFVAPNARAGPNDDIVRGELKQCAACAAGAVGRYANVDVCGVHLAAAQTAGERLNPGEPWNADLTQWALEQRKGAAA